MVSLENLVIWVLHLKPSDSKCAEKEREVNTDAKITDSTDIRCQMELEKESFRNESFPSKIEMLDEDYKTLHEECHKNVID